MAARPQFVAWLSTEQPCPALCPSGIPRMKRTGHLCHFHTTKGGECSQRSPCRRDNDQKSLLTACQAINQSHLNFVYHAAIKDVHYPEGCECTRALDVRIWSCLLRLASSRHNSPRVILLSLWLIAIAQWSTSCIAR